MTLIANPQKLHDPILCKIQEGIEKMLIPQERSAYMRVLGVGIKKMSTPEIKRQMEQRLSVNDDELPDAVGDGISDLLLLIHQQLGSEKLIPSMGPASLVLMCRALDFGKQHLRVKVTNDLVDNCTLSVIKQFFEKFGIDARAGEEHLQNLAATPTTKRGN